MEEWRTVPSLPNYEVSSLGRVRHKPFVGKMPNGSKRMYGGEEWFGFLHPRYKRYHFVYRGKSYAVARLVCEAFHGPPFHKAVCMHLDDSPANNRPENLKWGTQKENLNAPAHRAYRRSRVGDLSNIRIGLARKAARLAAERANET